MTRRSARVCSRCVMDDSDPDIDFDTDGVCNHCHDYAARAAAHDEARRAEPVETLVERIRAAGRGRPYDCVIGLSGGVDSSYLAYLAVLWGLRPLAVHLDNGWDSELAVQNIEHLITKLEIDLVTHVIDWEEFRDIQLAFFEAGVIDIELPTDNAIAALLLRTARRENVRFVLRGNNDTTEAVMPRAWNHRKTDVRNLRAIHARHGERPLRTLPTVSGLQLLRWERLGRLEAVNVLDRIDYDRTEAIRVLRDELGWRPYEGKHGESVFTRFYQATVLPRKFGVDKRKAHLSALVNAGEMTRDEALAELAGPPVDPDTAESDRRYALKKLRIDEETFDRWMSSAPVPHRAYPTEERWMTPLVRLAGLLRR